MQRQVTLDFMTTNLASHFVTDIIQPHHPLFIICLHVRRIYQTFHEKKNSATQGRNSFHTRGEVPALLQRTRGALQAQVNS